LFLLYLMEAFYASFLAYEQLLLDESCASRNFCRIGESRVMLTLFNLP